MPMLPMEFREGELEIKFMSNIINNQNTNNNNNSFDATNIFQSLNM